MYEKYNHHRVPEERTRPKCGHRGKRKAVHQAMFRSGIAWLKLQTKLSIAIFSLQCLLINSILLFFTLKDKVLLEFDIEQQPLLLYVITLVVRFLAGVVTDLGLLIGVYFSMKALIIVNVVWKGTGAIFDIVHGATFFPLVYQQLRQLIDHIFSNEGLASVVSALCRFLDFSQH
ncbi:hypothetical protein HPB51_013877 [Rhipicephalus microplus]|uniref:Uncharacterized protein n=1 Tax=Rhipicephalus microplus TaxID=6941 RepID=A0A9J6F3R7_RHIMP|nr:hypothetical protein HPB51_013877 [Rhipicephalus microplus]